MQGVLLLAQCSLHIMQSSSCILQSSSCLMQSTPCLMQSPSLQFAAGYERLKGKHCIFPFGFHCTGMPIRVGHMTIT